MEQPQEFRAAHIASCGACQQKGYSLGHLKCLALSGETIVIGFDMDNVLTLFEKALRGDSWNVLYPQLKVSVHNPINWGLERDVIETHGAKKVIQVLEARFGAGYVTKRARRPDDPEWHIREAIRDRLMKILGTPGFFRHLEPIQKNVDELKHIASLTRKDGTPRYVIAIVTTAPREYGGPRAEKINWLRDALGEELYNRVIPITTPDKTLILMHALFDDKHRIKGTFQPSFEHIVVDMPYNRKGPAAEKLRVSEGERWAEKLGL